MKLVIIPDDSFVSIDGVGYSPLDMAGIPIDVHAVQWYGLAGQIEFKVNESGIKPDNQNITSIEPYQAIIDQWHAADYAEKNTQPPDWTIVNVAIAKTKLQESDWSQLPDVNIFNRDEFTSYRAFLRSVVINPPAKEIIFPSAPNAVWY